MLLWTLLTNQRDLSNGHFCDCQHFCLGVINIGKKRRNTERKIWTKSVNSVVLYPFLGEKSRTGTCSKKNFLYPIYFAA